MKIKSIQGGFDKNLSYLIWCESTQKAGIIDASVNITEIYECMEMNDLRLEKVFITHTHFDHINFLYDILYQFPHVQICGFEHPENELGNNYRKLKHHEIIPLGSEMLTVLHTPGHYPDSLCFWNRKENCIFTGDTMFVSRPGRTIGTKSNISNLYNSIYKHLLKLPEQTIIYPGHHYGYTPSVTLKENISLSPFFQCESEKEFVKVMADYEKNR
jgi:glyoxylase-like metal-dependent hydrolase (beta-lactamase superfamily II)